MDRVQIFTRQPSACSELVRLRRAATVGVGLGLASVIALGGCSIASDESATTEAVVRAPKRQIIQPSGAEVLGVVATPLPEPTAVPPTPEPTPTLTASRVVVYSTGDWIIGGDEIVTIHDGPAGEPVGAVAVGVQVSATGAGRVLDGVTWVEVELPDGQVGYVPSTELRVVHHAEPTSTPDPQGLLGEAARIEVTADPLVGQVDGEDPPATLASADQGQATDQAAAEQLGSAETFVIAAYDPNDNEYSVTGSRVSFFVEIDQELIARWDLSTGMVVEVTNAMGRVINGVPFAAVRFRTIDGWIDVRELRRASAQAQ